MTENTTPGARVAELRASILDLVNAQRKPLAAILRKAATIAQDDPLSAAAELLNIADEICREPKL